MWTPSDQHAICFELYGSPTGDTAPVQRNLEFIRRIQYKGRFNAKMENIEVALGYLVGERAETPFGCCLRNLGPFAYCVRVPNCPEMTACVGCHFEEGDERCEFHIASDDSSGSTRLTAINIMETSACNMLIVLHYADSVYKQLGSDLSAVFKDLNTLLGGSYDSDFDAMNRRYDTANKSCSLAQRNSMEIMGLFKELEVAMQYHIALSKRDPEKRADQQASR
ncbi:hypothetical protein N7456_007442 [Penicillium angulare]|uniref:Uncharacterized protein n=1 Tax=Penicillium angulare TaxID=116970 RepID=A0A9W9K8S3_9EURO|nr:hypothetical protein N7456_007442 [Penicillium angulare]